LDNWLLFLDVEQGQLQLKRKRSTDLIRGLSQQQRGIDTLTTVCIRERAVPERRITEYDGEKSYEIVPALVEHTPKGMRRLMRLAENYRAGDDSRLHMLLWRKQDVKSILNANKPLAGGSCFIACTERVLGYTNGLPSNP